MPYQPWATSWILFAATLFFSSCHLRHAILFAGPHKHQHAPVSGPLHSCSLSCSHVHSALYSNIPPQEVIPYTLLQRK